MNVLLPVGVIVAGALTGAAWLTAVAVACWLALVGMAYRDREAAVPAEPLAPAIAARLQAADEACAGIREAIATTGAPLEDIGREADALGAAIRGDAARAQEIHAFLAEGPRADPAALARVRDRLDALLGGMDHVVAALQTVRAEILAAEPDDPAGLVPSLAAQVSELRVRAGILARGLEDSVAETRVAAGVDRDTMGP
jgi:hypothetical protein